MIINRRSPWHARRALRREVDRGYFRQTGVATTPQEFAEEARTEPRLSIADTGAMSHAFRYHPMTGRYFSIKRKVDRTWAIRTLRSYGWQQRWIAELFGVSTKRVSQILKGTGWGWC